MKNKQKQQKSNTLFGKDIKEYKYIVSFMLLLGTLMILDCSPLRRYFDLLDRALMYIGIVGLMMLILDRYCQKILSGAFDREINYRKLKKFLLKKQVKINKLLNLSNSNDENANKILFSTNEWEAEYSKYEEFATPEDNNWCFELRYMAEEKYTKEKIDQLITTISNEQKVSPDTLSIFGKVMVQLWLATHCDDYYHESLNNAYQEINRYLSKTI